MRVCSINVGSPQEKALLLATRRQEATDDARESLRVLSGLGMDEDEVHSQMLHNSTRLPSLSKNSATSSVTDRQSAAATRIQSFYRARKALSRMSATQAEHDVYRRDLVLPVSLDFVAT